MSLNPHKQDTFCNLNNAMKLIYPIYNSLCLRFVTNQIRPYSEATIGASFMSKTIIISGRSDDDVVHAVNTAQLNAVQVNPDERQIGFKIWDTAGQEKYRSLAPILPWKSGGHTCL